MICSTLVAGFMGSFIGAACGWIVFAPADKPVVISYDSELTSPSPPQPQPIDLNSSIIQNSTNIDDIKKEE